MCYFLFKTYLYIRHDTLFLLSKEQHMLRMNNENKLLKNMKLIQNHNNEFLTKSSIYSPLMLKMSIIFFNNTTSHLNTYTPYPLQRSPFCRLLRRSPAHIRHHARDPRETPTNPHPSPCL